MVDRAYVADNEAETRRLRDLVARLGDEDLARSIHRREHLEEIERAVGRQAVPLYADIASLRGTAGSLKKPLSWEEMREIAREDHPREECPGPR